MNNSIIVIDDDFDFLEILKEKLIRIDFTNVRTEVDSIKAASLFEKGQVFDVALIDMTMPDMDGIQLLELIKNTSPGTECIMVTAVNDARVAVDCLKKGAYDYLLKPIAREDLALSIHRALERKRLLDILDVKKKASLPKLIYADTFKPIITQSHKVLRILKEAELHAISDVPILITGESGTGKELLAKAIHCTSPRSKFKFTPVNMASLTSGLFEAEFFGHTKGAFTGAENGRAGFLEHTNQGTLFLDEIGNLPLELQGKLLRVLQDGEYMKLGSSSHHTADVRFITATNEDLDKLMARGMFRKDLYYRIRCGWLHLPPLRERKEDIPLLVKKFLITPPLFDLKAIKPFLKKIDQTKVKIIPTVLLLKSLGMARYMARNMKHIHISDELISRIQKAPDKVRECIRIASDMITALKQEGFSGVMISTIGWEDKLPDILEKT